jgi:hypothetical protein
MDSTLTPAAQHEIAAVIHEVHEERYLVKVWYIEDAPSTLSSADFDPIALKLVVEILL